MKRLFLCILSFAAGLAGGSTVRFTQHWQHGYRQGYVAAAGDLQREAVREGHGHWERRANTVGFSWNEVRREYEPDRPTLIPGLE